MHQRSDKGLGSSGNWEEVVQDVCPLHPQGPKACQVLSFLDDFIETREPTARGPGPLTCGPAVFSVLPWPSPPLAPSCPSVESSLLSLPESSRPENTLSSLSERPESLPSPRLGARAQRTEGCKEHSVNDGRRHSLPLGHTWTHSSVWPASEARS